jgi:Holliday junction resolvase-like predicted endonuclease
MTDPRHARGVAAERAVADWLTAHDWRIVASRQREAGGELDLVAVDPTEWLVAIEVRLRQTARTGDPLASVSVRHLQRVRSALIAYARRSAIPHRGLRVDLVAVVPGPRPDSWRLTRTPAVDGW